MQTPDAVTQVQMTSLTLGGLHALISDRLGRVPPRPTMVRIHHISGGNPLYALELARALTDEPGGEDQFPDTLAALVQARLRGMDTPTRRMLLAAASTPEPTVDVVAAATGTSAQQVTERLEGDEGAQIVSIIGNRIRFHHPVLAAGVYTAAHARQRRELHRLLAESVQAPELKARHLAKAAVRGDSATLNALDAAAALTRSKGDPPLRRNCSKRRSHSAATRPCGGSRQLSITSGQVLSDQHAVSCSRRSRICPQVPSAAWR